AGVRQYERARRAVLKLTGRFGPWPRGHRAGSGPRSRRGRRRPRRVSHAVTRLRVAEGRISCVGSPQTMSEADRRLVAVWAADCAERVLGLFEAEAPGDSRPRDAIAGLRAFARRQLRVR